VSYNRATGIAKVVAPTKVILDTPLVHCTGDVQVDGTMTASEDAIGGGVSLKNHIHGGVMVGPSVTTPPVA
jgi:phage baseplate assembly protein gpV